MKAFLDRLTDEEVAAIVAGMKEIVAEGLAAARHLQGDIFEVRADASTRSFRLLFSAEGRWSQIEGSDAEGTDGARDLRSPSLSHHSVYAIALKMHTRGMAKDFVAEIVAARTRKNPHFPQLVAEAEARRKLARRLAAIREKRALSQTVVAARMGTSASVVSKLEAGGDVKMSTFQRYCAAIGETLTFGAAPARRIAR